MSNIKKFFLLFLMIFETKYVFAQGGSTQTINLNPIVGGVKGLLDARRDTERSILGLSTSSNQSTASTELESILSEATPSADSSINLQPQRPHKAASFIQMSDLPYYILPSETSIEQDLENHINHIIKMLNLLRKPIPQVSFSEKILRARIAGQFLTLTFQNSDGKTHEEYFRIVPENYPFSTFTFYFNSQEDGIKGTKIRLSKIAFELYNILREIGYYTSFITDLIMRQSFDSNDTMLHIGNIFKFSMDNKELNPADWLILFSNKVMDQRSQNDVLLPKIKIYADEFDMNFHGVSFLVKTRERFRSLINPDRYFTENFKKLIEHISEMQDLAHYVIQLNLNIHPEYNNQPIMRFALDPKSKTSDRIFFTTLDGAFFSFLGSETFSISPIKNLVEQSIKDNEIDSSHRLKLINLISSILKDIQNSRKEFNEKISKLSRELSRSRESKVIFLVGVKDGHQLHALDAKSIISIIKSLAESSQGCPIIKTTDTGYHIMFGDGVALYVNDAQKLAAKRVKALYI
jgi:hypothetical protein